MQVTLGRQFLDVLNRFVRDLDGWRKRGRTELRRAMQRIGQRHKAEAVKRVPVDEGFLRNKILTNTYEAFLGELLTETGTNVRGYPVHLEFGTKHIAGGRVKALGDNPEITDAQAIHDWPAKRGEATSKTSAQLTTDKNGRQRLRNDRGQFVRGRPQEQMPWLRPSFMAIRDWAIEQIDESMEPPKQSL